MSRHDCCQRPVPLRFVGIRKCRAHSREHKYTLVSRLLWHKTSLKKRTLRARTFWLAKFWLTGPLGARARPVRTSGAAGGGATGGGGGRRGLGNPTSGGGGGRAGRKETRYNLPSDLRIIPAGNVLLLSLRCLTAARSKLFHQCIHIFLHTSCNQDGHSVYLCISLLDWLGWAVEPFGLQFAFVLRYARFTLLRSRSSTSTFSDTLSGKHFREASV